ncbi:MAG: PAS domain-containing protein [Sphingomonadales bacterium]
MSDHAGPSPAPVTALPAFLQQGGACAALIAARDWSGTLGPLEHWPASLRTSLAIVLRSPVPMVMLWGSAGIMLYNDAYSVFAGGRHPALLGSPVRAGWPEVADFNDHVMATCLAGGTLAYRDQQLILHRSGVPEAVWMDLTYSPIAGEDGVPAGVLAIVVETSSRVAAQARARDSEASLRAAVEQMPIGITLAAVETGGVVHMNRAGAAIIGTDTPPAGVDGYAVWGAVHADGTPYQPADYPLARAVQHGEEVHAEPMRYRRPDGRLVRLEVSAARVHDGDGRALLAVCAFSDITERFEAEQQLRESEGRLRRACEAGGIGTYEWDLVSGSGSQSDSMLRLAGLPPGRPYSLREMLAVVHPDDISHVLATVAKIAEGADRVETDYRVQHDAGGHRWLRDIGTLERDSAGRPLRWVGVVQDVTQRAEADARLRENEERLRLATHAAQMGTWDLDMRTGTGAWDGAAMQILGVTRTAPDYDALSWLHDIHPDDRERVAAAFAASIADADTKFDVEFRAAMPAGDGHDRWVTSHGVVIRDAAGRPVRAVGILRDVSERRREVERLRQSEQRLMLAEEAGGIGMWDWNLQTGSVVWSPGYYRVWGHDPAEPPGFEAFLARLEMAQRVTVAESVAAARASGQAWSMEARTSGPDGQRRVIACRGRFIKGADGSAERMLGVCMDITARTSAEQALRELNERLESEVERRTEQLVQAQDALRQSQKMEALGQLTGGVAHDFNNLLGAVVGSLDLIRRAPDNADKVRRLAELGLSAADRGAKLTGQLLAFSRAQRIELKPVDLAALVLGLHDLLSRTLGPMIAISFDVCRRAVVLSDATQLELALLNLAINSRDAMPAGGRLALSCQLHFHPGDAHLPAGTYVALRVSDTGGGMPPDVAARAFDPFFTTKALGEGTGLGLSQVHGIVRQSGGDVRIESHPGAGTSVTLLLPHSDSDAARADAASPPARLQRWHGTALVIDDDPGIRATLAGCLELLGLDCVFENNGADGLARLDALSPRLLILDYAMPGMTGAEVAAQVRERRPELPIIFCTGYSDTALIEAAAGRDVLVLRKPFRLGDLEAAVDTALGREAAAPA